MQKFVRNDIASKWDNLGVELLDDEQLSKLKNIAKNEDEVEDRCTKLFNYWLDTDPDASWNKLLEALKNMEQNNLVDKIKRKVLKGIDVTPYMYVYECVCIAIAGR